MAFLDAACVEYLTKPRIPEGVVHLIIGDRLVRSLSRARVHWQIGIFISSGAAKPQMLASLEILDVRKLHTVTMMKGTNDDIEVYISKKNPAF